MHVSYEKPYDVVQARSVLWRPEQNNPNNICNRLKKNYAFY